MERDHNFGAFPNQANDRMRKGRGLQPGADDGIMKCPADTSAGEWEMKEQTRNYMRKWPKHKMKRK
jgi:hypothetical protein